MASDDLATDEQPAPADLNAAAQTHRQNAGALIGAAYNPSPEDIERLEAENARYHRAELVSELLRAGVKPSKLVATARFLMLYVKNG